MFLCMIKESAALPPSLLQVFNRGLSPIMLIRDRSTGQLIDISNVKTSLERRN